MIKRLSSKISILGEKKKTPGAIYMYPRQSMKPPGPPGSMLKYVEILVENNIKPTLNRGEGGFSLFGVPCINGFFYLPLERGSVMTKIAGATAMQNQVQNQYFEPRA